MIVTLLGAGTGSSRIDRFGRAILVEAAGQPLLFDCGRGATIRLHQARVLAAHVTAVFLTQLHSDHVGGLPDLWLTGWLLGRGVPLRVSGPDRTRGMTERLIRRYAAHLELDETGGGHLPAEGGAIRSSVLQPGVPLTESGVRVTPFSGGSGALGYRLEHDGRAVIICGDTTSPALIETATGADVFVHAPRLAHPEGSRQSVRHPIGSAEEAGRLFAEVTPGIAVVYSHMDTAGLEECVRRFYSGPLVIGRDCMCIEVTERGLDEWISRARTGRTERPRRPTARSTISKASVARRSLAAANPSPHPRTHADV